MMSDEPIYHTHADRGDVTLEGQAQVRNLFRMWAETSQTIFYVENDEVAVADHFIATASPSLPASTQKIAHGVPRAVLPHIVSERIVRQSLTLKDFKADENEMYLYKLVVEMVWPCDVRGRLVGEDIWEPDPSKAELIELGPTEVLTTSQAACQLSPLIKLLASFDEVVQKKRRAHSADR
jgi:hypothetical protein